MQDPDFGSQRRYDLSATALVLIGFQNDFFAADGALRTSLEDPAGLNRALGSTVSMVRRLIDSAATIVAAPIGFTATYEELVDPVGILAGIKSASAFRRGSRGADMVDELRPFLARIKVMPGRRGFDAFANTDLGDMLSEAGIRDVLIAGALDSVCVDSTARCAFERGYRVTVLSDCTVGRTAFEHDFFCDSIFPMYADVIESTTFLERSGAAEPVM